MFLIKPFALAVNLQMRYGAGLATVNWTFLVKLTASKVLV
jgi:hypothetical protein